MREQTYGAGRPAFSARLALWVGAALALLVPLVAGFPWTAGDYVFAAILMFGSLALYEVVARTQGSTAYRAGAGLAIGGVFLLEWSNGAVGLTDGAADAAYALLVPAVAVIGALLARFRPAGMARAMWATAGTVAAIAVVALAAGLVPAFNPATEILGIAFFFVLLFGGSALLFRKAVEEEPGAET